jgi:hypothetical protein
MTGRAGLVWAAAAGIVLAAALAPLRAGEAPEGPKADPKANPGRTIQGRLGPPERVRKAWLWDRGPDTTVPLAVDPKTGEFEARGLALGTWDLVIETPWGRAEGVDMAPKLSDYDALIPPEYRTEDLGLEAGGKVSDEDLKAIRRHIHEVKRHENRVRDLAIAGTADRACVLVELVLDRDFVGRKGDEIVWRMEQWYYEKKYEAWTRFRTRVLARHRVSKRVWATWGWQFEPALGGFNITDERAAPAVVRYTVPERPAPEKGLAGSRLPPPPTK